jgi:uncharacterized membrane protein
VDLARDEDLTARLVFVTDGVVAIAMTLLVLDIRLPEGVAEAGVGWQELLGIRGQVTSYVLSFMVIALLWLNHAQRLRGVVGFTGTLFWLNMLFLLAVGLVPFTASLLAASGDSVATAIYAGVMGFAALMLGLIAVHVRTARLAGEEGGYETAGSRLLHFFTPAVFFVSMGISAWSAHAAQLFWALLIPLALAESALDK